VLTPAAATTAISTPSWGILVLIGCPVASLS
jgi:hypothetical protein